MTKLKLNVSLDQHLNRNRIKKWESIYQTQKKRWNGLQSKLAEITLKFVYHNDGIKNILDVGGGYGRDALYFVKFDYNVINIESSKTAIEILKKETKDSPLKNSLSLINGDIFETSKHPAILSMSNLIFCNYFFHLLTFGELYELLNYFATSAKPKTLVAFNLISKKDCRYLEKDFAEVEKDITWSFWDNSDIVTLINKYPFRVLFWEEEVEIEYINKQFDKVNTHFIIVEIIGGHNE